MAAKGQIRVDADLERPRAKLVETLGLRTALQVQRHARENRAVPEAERLLREGRGTRMVTGGQRLGCLVYERLEDLRVENSPTEVDPVAAPASLDGNPVRGESPAEPGHVGLQAVRCGRRGIIPPDLVDQALDGHDLVPAEKQRLREQPAACPRRARARVPRPRLRARRECETGEVLTRPCQLANHASQFLESRRFRAFCEPAARPLSDPACDIDQRNERRKERHNVTNRIRHLGAVGLVVTVGLAASSGSRVRAGHRVSAGNGLGASESKIAFTRVAKISNEQTKSAPNRRDLRHERRREREAVADASTSHVYAWSPDGRKIAFGKWRDGNDDIYVMNADGSGQRNLTRTRNACSTKARSGRPTGGRSPS